MHAQCAFFQCVAKAFQELIVSIWIHQWCLSSLYWTYYIQHFRNPTLQEANTFLLLGSLWLCRSISLLGEKGRGERGWGEVMEATHTKLAGVALCCVTAWVEFHATLGWQRGWGPPLYLLFLLVLCHLLSQGGLVKQIAVKIHTKVKYNFEYTSLGQSLQASGSWYHRISSRNFLLRTGSKGRPLQRCQGTEAASPLSVTYLLELVIWGKLVARRAIGKPVLFQFPGAWEAGQIALYSSDSHSLLSNQRFNVRPAKDQFVYLQGASGAVGRAVVSLLDSAMFGSGWK